MKFLRRPFLLVLCLSIFLSGINAQLFPGMRVNGRIVNQGDTVNVCQGSSLFYQNTATGATAITWKFKKGSPATYNGSDPPLIVYNSLGIDSTIQFISSGSNRDSFYIMVRVTNVKPLVNYSFSPNGVCGDVPISFTNNSSGVQNTYSWNFDDGTISSNLSPVHQFLDAIGAPGGSQIYNVKLIATNSFGCKDSVIKPVSIKTTPDASIGNADPGVTYVPQNQTFKVCTNIPSYVFQFTNQSATIATNVSYTISWGDGFPDSTFSSWPSGSIIQHAYIIGSKKLTVKVTGPDGCVGIKTYTVFLGTNPAGGFISLGNTNICAPDSLRFVITGYANNAPGTVYTVTINDGSAPQIFTHPPPDTITHFFTFTSCGTSSSNGTIQFDNSFNATLNIENPCDLTSASVVPIYVSGKPKAIISVNSGNTACTNTPVFIQSASTYGGVVTSTGGGNSTCLNTGRQVWAISPSTGYTITNGSMGSLNGSPANGLLWTSGTTFLDANFTATGTYTIKLYIFNERCGLDSTTYVICVRNPPQASFSMSNKSACATGTTVITNTSPIGICQGDTYDWRVVYSDPGNCGTSAGTYNFINGTDAASVNPELEFTAPGKYIITLTTSALGSFSCPAAIRRDTFTVKGNPTATINPINDICANNTITPSAIVSSCYADSTLDYAWTFTNGNPQTAVTLSPGAVSYSLLGTHPIQLTLSSECGTVTAASSVNVIALPLANAGSDKDICSGADIIVGSNAATGITYQWAPQTGLSDPGIANPTLTLTYNGNNADTLYTYVLTVSAGANCSNTDTILVRVRKSPLLTLNPTSAAVCEGLSVQLTATGATSYSWSPALGLNVANTDNIIATPVDTTSYQVIGLAPNGCADTAAVTVNVNRDAEALYTADLTTSCSPFDLSKVISVSIFPDRNGLYEWYADGVLFGSNNTGTFPGYTISAPPDTVIIKLKTTSPFGCKPDSIEKQFITTLSSQAKFIKDTSVGCGFLPVVFTNTSSPLNGVQFFWDFGNGTTSNLIRPGTVVFNSSPFFNDTTYQVTLKVYNGCDTTIWRDSINVKTLPQARFGVDTTFACSPFTVQINNTSPGGPNTYYWDFGNGATDTTFTNGILNYTYNTGGATDTFTIRLIAENQCGRDTQSIDIRIAPNIIRPLINVNSSQLFGCTPHTVAFNNNTSGATGYTWNFGDGTDPVITNNNQSTVIHTYTDTGTFTVQVNITNGCSDTIVFRQVTVYAKPLAAFTTNANGYCAGDTVRVINVSQGATNYRWFWDDGTTSTGVNPTHVFMSAGNYNILLRAERSNSAGLVCLDTLVRPVTVLAKPVVTVQSNINTINCAPFTLNVTAPGIINETASWYFYDSTVTPLPVIIKGSIAQYTFNKPGNFSVKLVAKNSLGCSDSTIISFTVRGKAVASFTPANLAVCTRDTTISYVNTSTYDGIDPVSYKWIVDNAIVSTGGNFTHRYSVLPGAVLPRTFITSLIVSNTVGCSDTATATLQMNPTAEARFSITNQNECVPFAPVIVNASTYAASYKWIVNGNTVSNTADPGIFITQGSTLYTISLIADNIYGCKPDTFTVSFTSRARPAAAFTLSDTLGCTGLLNVGSTNLTTGAGSYIWNWGDGTPNSVFTSPTHLYNAPGQYLVTLVASDGVCRDTTEQLVKVSIKPVVDFAVDQTLTCDTARVQFTNLSVNGTDYTWSFGDGTFSTATNPFKIYAPRNFAYTVKLVASSSIGCKDSAVKANLVLAKISPASDFLISPSPVITVPNYTFNFNNLTLNSSNYKYLWSLGDGTFATTRDVTHKYPDTGNYPIRLIVLDTVTNCPDTTIKVARIDGFPGYLYVPNAICPACIQTNLREFLPKGAGLKEYRLQIFTTWNELIFETKTLDSKGSPTQAWDGKFKGAIVQQDVYVWRIDAVFLNGSEWLGMIYPGEGKYKKVGTITVVK